MPELERIMNGLKSGKTPDELAQSLNLRKRTIQAMLEVLVHEGKVKVVDCNSSCEGCFMGDSCPGTISGREKMYMVIEEPNEGTEG